MKTTMSDKLTPLQRARVEKGLSLDKLLYALWQNPEGMHISRATLNRFEKLNHFDNIVDAARLAVVCDVLSIKVRDIDPEADELLKSFSDLLSRTSCCMALAS